MSKAVSRQSPQEVAEVRLNALTKMLEDCAEDDARMLVVSKRGGRELDSVEHGMQLLQLPTEELKKLGWTREDLRVAIDGKKNGKEVPFYLKAAQERTLVRSRDGLGDPGGGNGRSTVVLIPVPQQSRRDESAPAIEISEVGKVK